MPIVKKRGKFNNIKIIRGGVRFDSKLEYECYQYLIKLFGKDNIKLQYDIEYVINSKKIFKVVLDFVITLKNKKKIYVDAKGIFTPIARLKYKILRIGMGIDIMLYPKNVKNIHAYIEDSKC